MISSVGTRDSGGGGSSVPLGECLLLDFDPLLFKRRHDLCASALSHVLGACR